METLVINFIGGPGSGKSTMATGVFSILKCKGYDCEYVSEFAKDCVWEERYETFKDELYIYAKQHHRMLRLKNKVQIIITDRPLFMTLYYNKDNNTKYLNELCLADFNSYNNYNVFINRTKEYNHNGRNESLEEALQIDEGYKQIMKDNKLSINQIVDSTFENIQNVAEVIDSYIKSKRTI